ncbi:MAG: SMP-30/gluconolactonase/LRE family protein, partial [Planctomycetes bacterium]|nr:SMP-30/gluconolactonase/LRE family protein [Planctomycetota bacterium]
GGRGGAGALQYPRGFAVRRAPDGSADEVLLTDSWNHRLLYFRYSGNELDMYRAVNADQGSFEKPDGVAFPPDGGAWVVSRQHSRVVRFNEQGKPVEQVGFFQPRGAERAASRARLFTPRAWRPDDTPDTGVGLAYPSGLKVSPQGDLFVADEPSARILRVRDGRCLSRIEIDGALSAITHLAVTAEFLLVADALARRVAAYTHDGLRLAVLSFDAPCHAILPDGADLIVITPLSFRRYRFGLLELTAAEAAARVPAADLDARGRAMLLQRALPPDLLRDAVEAAPPGGAALETRRIVAKESLRGHLPLPDPGRCWESVTMLAASARAALDEAAATLEKAVVPVKPATQWRIEPDGTESAAALYAQVKGAAERLRDHCAEAITDFATASALAARAVREERHFTHGARQKAIDALTSAASAARARYDEFAIWAGDETAIARWPAIADEHARAEPEGFAREMVGAAAWRMLFSWLELAQEMCVALRRPMSTLPWWAARGDILPPPLSWLDPGCCAAPPVPRAVLEETVAARPTPLAISEMWKFHAPDLASREEVLDRVVALRDRFAGCCARLWRTGPFQGENTAVAKLAPWRRIAGVLRRLAHRMVSGGVAPREETSRRAFLARTAREDLRLLLPAAPRAQSPREAITAGFSPLVPPTFTIERVITGRELEAAGVARLRGLHGAADGLWTSTAPDTNYMVKLDAAGRVLSRLGWDGLNAAPFQQGFPGGADAAGGFLAWDHTLSRVRRYDAAGRVTAEFGKEGDKPSEFEMLAEIIPCPDEPAFWASFLYIPALRKYTLEGARLAEVPLPFLPRVPGTENLLVTRVAAAPGGGFCISSVLTGHLFRVGADGAVLTKSDPTDWCDDPRSLALPGTLGFVAGFVWLTLPALGRVTLLDADLRPAGVIPNPDELGDLAEPIALCPMPFCGPDHVAIGYANLNFGINAIVIGRLASAGGGAGGEAG